MVASAAAFIVEHSDGEGSAVRFTVHSGQTKIMIELKRRSFRTRASLI